MSAIDYSIFSIVIDSELKFARTRLELNKISTLSFSTPSKPLSAFSIFCRHAGHDKVSKLLTAFCIIYLSFLVFDYYTNLLYLQYHAIFVCIPSCTSMFIFKCIDDNALNAYHLK